MSQLALKLRVQPGGGQRQLAFAALCGGLGLQLATQLGLIASHAQGRQPQCAAGRLGVPAAGGAGLTKLQKVQCPWRLAGNGARRLHTGLKAHRRALASHGGPAVQGQGREPTVQHGRIKALQRGLQLPGLRLCCSAAPFAAC